MLKKDRKNKFKDVELHIVGSCRNEGDRARQKELEQLRDELGLDPSRVVFHVNAPYVLCVVYSSILVLQFLVHTHTHTTDTRIS